MIAFVIRRALQALGVLFAVALISFSMFRFAGDPVNQMVGAETPPAERLQIRRSLGLDLMTELFELRLRRGAALGLALGGLARAPFLERGIPDGARARQLTGVDRVFAHG